MPFVPPIVSFTRVSFVNPFRFPIIIWHFTDPFGVDRHEFCLAGIFGLSPIIVFQRIKLLCILIKNRKQIHKKSCQIFHYIGNYLHNFSFRRDFRRVQGFSMTQWLSRVFDDLMIAKAFNGFQGFSKKPNNFDYSR